MAFGTHYGAFNVGRASYVEWLDKNPGLAVQYDHRRVRRFEKPDATDNTGKTALPFPSEVGDEIVEVKRDGQLFAMALCVKTSAGTRIYWKQVDQMTADEIPDGHAEQHHGNQCRPGVDTAAEVRRQIAARHHLE